MEIKKVFYNNDVYELTHTYEHEAGSTLMIAYRQPNGFRGYEIKVSEDQCQSVLDNGMNKRQMLVRTGWQYDDAVLTEQCKRDYGDIRDDYQASEKNGKVSK